MLFLGERSNANLDFLRKGRGERDLTLLPHNCLKRDLSLVSMIVSPLYGNKEAGVLLPVVEMAEDEPITNKSNHHLIMMIGNRGWVHNNYDPPKVTTV